MSLGLEAAGFDIVGAVEIDPIHALVHHFNFPYGVTLCTDISQLISRDLKAKIEAQDFTEEIDLIAGGPPCQGFSLMGKRQLEDPRNQLIFEYLRIIQELQPKYFIFENVAGIAAGNHKQLLTELISQFEKMGYTITKPVQVLDAALYGAPQKRKRLFLLGSRQDVKPISYPQPHKISASLTTIEQAIADLAQIPIFQGKDRGIPTANLDYSGFRKNFSPDNLGHFQLCHHRSTSDQIWGHLGSKHTEISRQRFAATPAGKIEKISRFLRLDPTGLSNTLRAGTPSGKGAHTAPRPIHYQQPRCISIREAARLHTFPDWFQFHRTIWHGFREIGNAVVPLLVKQIGDEIMQAMEINPNDLTIKQLPQQSDIFLSYTMGDACSHWQIAPDTIPKRQRKSPVVQLST